MNASKHRDAGRGAEPAGKLVVRAALPEESGWFDRLLGEHHYLGAGVPVGDYLRQVVEREGKAVALLVWGPACYALKDRDRWVGWSAMRRAEALKLVVQNRRFLLLVARGSEPNLASQSMGAALRALRGQWRERFGYAPLLAESFTDPESFTGTCYKASNWEAVGMSAGYSRHRQDFYVPNDRPKKLWMIELCARARAILRSLELPAEYRPALIPAPSGTMPVSPSQMLSLEEVLRRAPDPRSKNTRFKIGPVLTLVALALLAGRRSVADIARFANSLTPAQRRSLGLPLKPGRRRFYEVPGYSVFYQLLGRMDPEAFAAILTRWLAENAGALPQVLALDGKMIRDQIGLVTLAQHDDGAPYALTICDQKEGTGRSEQSAALQMLQSQPALDGKTVTGDPLYCQAKIARAIVERGGDYLLQIKGNQPGLLTQARQINALDSTPFLTSPSAVADGSPLTRSPASPSRRKPPTSPSQEPSSWCVAPAPKSARAKPPRRPASTSPARNRANARPKAGWLSSKAIGLE